MRQLDPDPQILEELKSYLHTELTNHRAERAQLEDRWIAEKNDFWAEPSPGSPELPTTGFASIIVPITAIACEAIHARTMGQLFGLKELVTVDVADSAADIRSSLEKFFNTELQNNIDFRAAVESPLLQLTKHGTGVIMTGYRENKRMAVLDKDGNEIKVPVYYEKGATIDGIPIEDFIMPFYATDINCAPWVGHWFRVSEHTIRQMVANGQLAEDAYARMQSYYRGHDYTDRVLDAVRDMTNTDPIFPAEIRLARVLLDWDVDGNNELSGIEVIYHEDSKEILSLTYNDDRNYEKGVYMPLEYRWYGYGIAKQNHEFQVEITTQHRQRLDNATIANMAMFKVKRTATWIKDDEPIFPGKKFFVDSPDDIEPMFIGDVKASAYNNENQAYIYSQQRTSVNELTLGMPNVGTPGTASDSLARVQESTRKFDYVYNNIKDFLNRVVYRTAQNIIRYGPRDVAVFQYLPQGGQLEVFLKNIDALKNKTVFNIQLAGAKNNKVLDRQTYTQLSGMVTQYWTNLLAMAQQTQDPNLIQEMTKKAFTSADAIMLEILRSFDVPNPERLIFNFDAYRPTSVPQGNPEGAMGTFEGTSPVPAGGITSVSAPGAGIDATGGPPQLQVPGASLQFAG